MKALGLGLVKWQGGAKMTTGNNIGRAKHLVCCCCGGACMGRQWWNRDTGYSLCWECARDIPAGKIGRAATAEEMRDNYGVAGVHYFIDEESSTTKESKEFSKWLEANQNKGEL